MAQCAPEDFQTALHELAGPPDEPTPSAPLEAASRAAQLPADLAELDLCAAAALIAAGHIRSAELTEAVIARAERAQSQLNCFLRLDIDEARTAAAHADRRRNSGAPLGPLHGLPLAHKDMFDRAGKVALLGARMPAEPAAQNAVVIARLRAAGAFEIGALHMSEFAIGPIGDNAHYGRCRNAIDAEYMSGGSSSGSAVATAAHACLASLGSDSGGSVRIPAAANGIVGLKPTYGLVPLEGAMRLAPSVDHIGLVTRTVRDCARLLGVVANDGRGTTGSTRSDPRRYEATLNAGIEGLRIGIVRNYFRDGMSADVAVAQDRSLTVLHEAGAELIDVQAPDPEPLAELSRTLLYAEATAVHGWRLRHYAGRYSPQVRVRAATGLAIPASIYYEALCLRGLLLREFVAGAFARCDVLHMPTLVIPVPRFAEVDVGSGPALWQTLARLVQNTAPFNYLGLPALALPAGRTANGLPASVQLVARPFAERLLLRVAAAHEAGFATGHDSG
ncbi:MAG: amidase [Steroidobacteraceae bacterium]|nr:amidase [Steroidobacteraceae bacterium]MDW8259160.1 amidase [Gammaproteobacteria bacterium]